jgi:hypothetical protein
MGAGLKLPMPSGILHYEPSFKRASGRIREQAWFTKEWICKCGPWPSAAVSQSLVLKLLKRHWSNDDPAVIGNQSGIFFSLWIDATDKATLRFNIHALKLRNLKGYALESRKFAAAFRSTFAPLASSWPKHRDDFGPQTLIEGTTPIPPGGSDELLIDLAAKFAGASMLIDRLLEEAKKPLVPERL